MLVLAKMFFKRGGVVVPVAPLTNECESCSISERFERRKAAQVRIRQVFMKDQGAWSNQQLSQRIIDEKRELMRVVAHHADSLGSRGTIADEFARNCPINIGHRLSPEFASGNALKLER